MHSPVGLFVQPENEFPGRDTTAPPLPEYRRPYAWPDAGTAARSAPGSHCSRGRAPGLPLKCAPCASDCPPSASQPQQGDSSIASALHKACPVPHGFTSRLLLGSAYVLLVLM